MGFQKFFLFWVAGIILKVWKAELETDPVKGNYTVKNFNTGKPDLVLPFKTNDYIIQLLVIELSRKYLRRVKQAFRLFKPNFSLVIRNS